MGQQSRWTCDTCLSMHRSRSKMDLLRELMLQRFEEPSNNSTPWLQAGIGYIYPRGPTLRKPDPPFIIHPHLVRATNPLTFRFRCTESGISRIVKSQEFDTLVAQPEGGRSLLNPDATRFRSPIRVAWLYTKGEQSLRSKHCTSSSTALI